MATIPPEAGRTSPEVDKALVELIDSHLRSHGMALRPEQLLAIKQQGPVLELLRTVIDLGRREQAKLDEVTAQPVELRLAALPAPAPVEDDAEYERSSGEAMPEDNQDVAPVEPAPHDNAPIDASAPVIVEDPAPKAERLPEPAPVQAKARAFPDLRLPNGTADVDYRQVFDLSKNAEFEGFRIAAIDGLDGAGLAFDPSAGALHGVPRAEAGKSHEFKFRATLEECVGDRSQTGTCVITLFINPHPRSLWKEIEPDPILPYPKKHRRSDQIQGGGLRAVAASVRGRSHANSGTFREDDFDFRHDPSGAWTVVAVSDGAGSAKLSRRGSELACQHGVETLATSLAPVEDLLRAPVVVEDAEMRAADPRGIEPIKRALLEPVGRSAFLASKAIKTQAADLGVDEKALSATLLLAAARPYADGLLVASYWIGDGAAALFDPNAGTVQLLGDADSGEYSGQTRFLLSTEFGSNAWDGINRRFRCSWAPAGAVLVLMSDGVSDPKFGTENALKDRARWMSWWHDDLARSVDLSRDNAALPQEIEGYLGFWSQGEHDDRTLALVF